MSKNKLSDLRQEQINNEVEKAKAISSLSSVIISSAKVEIDFIRATDILETQSDLFKSVSDIKKIA